MYIVQYKLITVNSEEHFKYMLCRVARKMITVLRVYLRGKHIKNQYISIEKVTNQNIKNKTVHWNANYMWSIQLIRDVKSITSDDEAVAANARLTERLAN